MNPELRKRLDALLSDSYAEPLWPDPLAVVREYETEADIEAMGLVCSGLAYGRVEQIAASLRKLQEALGPHPAEFVAETDPHALLGTLAGFKHRFTTGEDVAALLLITNGMREAEGSVGAFFAKGYARGDMRGSLTSFVRRALTMPVGPCYGGAGLPEGAGVLYLLPSPEGGSACKRLNLYLRWMVRGPDGRDLGLWRDLVDTSDLIVPLDTHIARIGRALGLTQRKTADWKMAEEITASLARFDPGDPVRYDFPLARLGIMDRCPTRPDATLCAACSLRGFCALRAPGTPAEAGRDR